MAACSQPYAVKFLCSRMLACYNQFAGAIPHRMAYFGQGSGPVHIGATQCDGSEQRIEDCGLYTNN